jgi:hypothetical protein
VALLGAPFTRGPRLEPSVPMGKSGTGRIQQEWFAAIGKATVGLHYTKLLEVVQERMRILTDSLADYEVGRSAIENAARMESGRKLALVERRRILAK